jgi:hypothetical protein
MNNNNRPPQAPGYRRPDRIYEEEDYTGGLRPYYRGPMVRLQDIPYIKRPQGPNDDGAGGVGAGLKKHHKNRWIEHVKAYSKKHNVHYHLAIRQAKATYK